MNIEKVIQEDRQAILTVEYSVEEFEGFKRRAAKKIAKSTKIPGFRPGKAPYQVIVNHYGEGAVLQEAVDILLDDDYSNILKQADVEPSGTGNLETIESYDPPKFVFRVPLEPDVDLGSYREIRKAYELDEFDNTEVDKFIKGMLQNSATIVPADHPANEGDLVYFNLSGEFLNLDEGEDATITDKTPQQAVIPSDGEESEFEWPFSGFVKELKGVEAGQTKEVQHTFSDDHEDESYRGKTALFSAVVQSVKELELPEFDDEYVKTLGDYETTEDFKKAVEERLRAEQKESYDQVYFDELFDEITEKSTLIYPPQMLEHEEEHVFEDIKSRLTNNKMEFETYLKLRNTDEETFIKEEIQPVAKKRLERSLVIDALIESEGIKLDQEMLKEQINDVMTNIWYSGNAEEMQKQLGKEGFSRALSMEGFSRTMNAQIQNRLKLIATGQPIPAEGEEDAGQHDAETIPIEEPVEEIDSESASNEGQVEELDLEAIANEVPVEEPNEVKTKIAPDLDEETISSETSDADTATE